MYRCAVNKNFNKCLSINNNTTECNSMCTHFKLHFGKRGRDEMAYDAQYVAHNAYHPQNSFAAAFGIRSNAPKRETW